MINSNNKNTLLIVDDEKMNLKVLTNILISEYTIFTASNGKNAIEKAIEYKPDLILLDVIMPEMDGFQTFTEMKKNDDISHIPVIFVTGLNTNEAEEKGLSMDAVDYITKPFSSTIVKLRVRNQIQIINQMRTIEHLSMMDQLTGIPNRRSFDERLQHEWKNSIREQQPISLLMIDIDKFKNVNDTYGHQQGDVVLKSIAEILPALIRRSGDIAARWGGEEFVVLLLNTPLEGAMEVAGKIRAAVEEAEIPYNGDSVIKITVSIGVKTIIPGRDDVVNAFISNADKALYAAKDAGRNRVIASE